MEENYYRNKLKDFEKEMMENAEYKIPSKEDFKQLKTDRVGAIGFPVAREIVESGRIEEVVAFFKNIKITKGYFREKVLFSISGYDDDPRELFEIEDVMKWTRKVIDAVPYIFYYVHQDSRAFMMRSIAEKLTVVKPPAVLMLTREELARRQFMGEELPRNQFKTEVTLATKTHVLRGIKRFGFEINDTKYTTNLALYLSEKLPLLPGEE